MAQRFVILLAFLLSPLASVSADETSIHFCRLLMGTFLPAGKITITNAWGEAAPESKPTFYRTYVYHHDPQKISGGQLYFWLLRHHGNPDEEIKRNIQNFIISQFRIDLSYLNFGDITTHRRVGGEEIYVSDSGVENVGIGIEGSELSFHFDEIRRGFLLGDVLSSQLKRRLKLSLRNNNHLEVAIYHLAEFRDGNKWLPVPDAPEANLNFHGIFTRVGTALPDRASDQDPK